MAHQNHLDGPWAQSESVDDENLCEADRSHDYMDTASDISARMLWTH